jgi:hypothetical protein
MNYSEIAAINVNEHIEKKNNLSYLSWAWAVDTLLRHDSDAFWEYGELHYMQDHTVMVYCTVHAFGRHRTAQLPVMDYKNKSVPNPDAVQVNVTMQRALVKAIALHGLGLYIYAGEDLPIEFKHEESVDKPVDKSVDKPVDKSVDEPVAFRHYVETVKEIVVPTSANEAAAVDWVCSFVNEFIPSVETVDSLRDFWKVNKSVLTRVEKFSKPMYQALEINFKERAVQLKGKA